jgi:hypothetical protein
LLLAATLVALDIVAWRTELAARREYERAAEHPLTWVIVARDHPWSFTAAVARGQLAAHRAAGGALPTEATAVVPQDAVERSLQWSLQVMLAPTWRWAAAMTRSWPSLATALEQQGERAAAAQIDRRKVGYVPIAASVVGLLLAILLWLRWFRRRQPGFFWRASALLLALASAVLQYTRCTDQLGLGGLHDAAWAAPLETVLAPVIAVMLFCLHIWAPDATPLARREPRRAAAQPAC